MQLRKDINLGTIFSFIDKNFLIYRFFNQLLLPRVRDDIDEYQRLNYHLYQALRKALFKPGAFFKGKSYLLKSYNQTQSTQSESELF